MFAPPSITERPLMWSHVMEASRYWKDRPDYSETGTETTCVVSAFHLSVRAMRDWLDNEFDANFEMWGVFRGDELKPVAIRFKFANFDDKLLFALRWL